MDLTHSKPVIFDYMDLVSYLQDYYRFRKISNKSFSYDAWATELSLKNKSFLRLLVLGKKKASPRFTQAFTEAALENKTERLYFAHMVGAARAASAQERQSHLSQMLEILKYRTSAKVIEDSVDFVSNPVVPRLFSLLSFKDLDANLSLITKLLQTDRKIIHNALEKLAQMGLIESAGEGEDRIWKTSSDVFHVPDQFGSFDLINFHRKSLQEAVAAFQKPPEQRRYKSLLLPLGEADLAEFNRELENFATAQMIRFNSKTFRGKRMFQVNLNHYAVTEKID